MYIIMSTYFGLMYVTWTTDWRSLRFIIVSNDTWWIQCFSFGRILPTQRADQLDDVLLDSTDEVLKLPWDDWRRYLDYQELCCAVDCAVKFHLRNDIVSQNAPFGPKTNKTKTKPTELVPSISKLAQNEEESGDWEKVFVGSTPFLLPSILMLVRDRFIKISFFWVFLVAEQRFKY